MERVNIEEWNNLQWISKRKQFIPLIISNRNTAQCSYWNIIGRAGTTETTERIVP